MPTPLVSFCLQAYNQRDYIDAALDGAFAQTYRPLEIVISDDHSTDGTWERIQEKLKNSTVHLHLSPSPTVILHRNPTNLKNIANLEIFGTLAHGELLVKADSDDISEPDRVQRLVDAWLADAKRARVLSSGCRLIDATGRVLGERHTACLRYPTGAMMAWTRDCFVGWPAVPRAYMADDVVWCARAQLLGGAELVLPDPLVRYRTVGFTTRGTSYRASLARIHRTEIAALPTCLADIASYLAKGGDPSRADLVRADVTARADRAAAWLQVLEGRTLRTRLAGLRRAWPHYGTRGRVLLVLLALGLPAIGRSSCTSGTYLIKEYIHRNRIKKVTIVADNDAPGTAGARALKNFLLPTSHSLLTRIVYPPPGVKDLRAYLNKYPSVADARKSFDLLCSAIPFSL